MMKKVFLDTNILIDYLARRGQFFEPAAQIVQLGSAHMNSACLYLPCRLPRQVSYWRHITSCQKEAIVHKFAEFVTMCNVTPVDSFIVDEAIASRFFDFEDAMQYYSAVREGADAIITRNSSDFNDAEIEVYEPQQFLDMLAKE